jgi:uncharacterized membrane protein YhaH (DUF805 family)
VSTPYSPYGGAPNGPYDAPNGPYGAPSNGAYGAPSNGYGAPNNQYGAPSNQYGAPGGPYGAPNSGYGAPGGYAPQGGPQQRGYLQGGPVDFQSAFKLQIENVMNFNGRASLSAYWWYALGLFAVDMVLIIFSAVVGSIAFSMLLYLVMFAAGLSALSVGVRRLHDTDKSGWMLLLGLIPFIGGIIVLVLLVLPGTPGPNRFG